MEVRSLPLSNLWPCRFYSSLIQQLLSSMAVVKGPAIIGHCSETLVHSSPPLFLLHCDCLTPLYHSGCARNHHLLGYTAYMIFMLQCALHYLSKEREPHSLPAWCYWRCSNFLMCRIELAAAMSSDEHVAEVICCYF